jgi:PAS domain S-box-containing protein
MFFGGEFYYPLLKFKSIVENVMKVIKPTYEELEQKVKELTEENKKRDEGKKHLPINENNYRTLIEYLPQKIFFKNTNSLYVYCNENYARDLKIKTDGIAGKTDYDFFPRKLADKYTADDKRILELGKTEEIEEHYIQNGEKRYVKTVKTPVKDERGIPIGVLGIFWDITEHKQMEEDLITYRDHLEFLVCERTAELTKINELLQQEIIKRKQAETKLREREERFREVFENIGSGIAIYEPINNGEDFVFKDINSAGVRIGGIPLEEHIGKNLLAVYPGTQDIGLFDVFQQVWRTGIPKRQSATYYHDDRIGFWLETYICKLSNGEVMTVYDDVTERHLAEAKLQQSEELFREVFENIGSGIAIYEAINNGKDFVYKKVNPAGARTVGMPRENYIGRRLFELYPEGKWFYDMLYEVWHTGIAQPQPAGLYHDERINFWIEGFLFKLATGEVVHVFQDITERKQAEEETRRLGALLQEKNERLLALINSMNDEVWFIDTQRRYTLLNQLVCQRFGLVSGEPVDEKKLAANLKIYRPDGSIRTADESPAFRALQGEVIENLEEIIRIPATGELRYRQVNSTPVKDSSGNIIGSVSIVRDITTLKRTEKALIESESRVRKLNQHILNMLMVVAHDLRSPLVSLAATLKLLMRGVYGQMDPSVKNTAIDLHCRIENLLGVAEECLGKVSGVTGEIDFTKKMLDLREDIIDPVLEELSGEMEKQNILIDNRLGAIPAKRIPIKADKVWLKIVFRNLFSNAIKYGGKGCEIAFGFEDCGSYYKLNVYNNGAPVPEDSRNRLFDKFYRNEMDPGLPSQGMGLGLYLTKQIIQQHGGEIWYEPKERGSNFVLTLPHD